MATNVTESEDQREQRLADVARLYLEAVTQTAIGKQLGVSQQQISYDLKIVRQRWLESSIRNFDEARGHELAKIDCVEREFGLHGNARNESSRSQARSPKKEWAQVPRRASGKKSR